MRIVDKLCYLGDMLSQEGDCEHAILKRIQTGWLKFRELSGLFIRKEMSVRSNVIIYTTCIRSAMLDGSETKDRCGFMSHIPCFHRARMVPNF